MAITGASGQLGRQLVRAFAAAGHEVRALSHADLDIADAEAVAGLTTWAPDIVVNSAAWTDVDGCARDPERAMRLNGEAAGLIAAAAANAGAMAVQVSTNEVFDGARDQPYRADDEPSPINAYGRSKLAGERAVAAANPRHLIVRTAWLFGPGGTNFVTKIVAAASRAADSSQPLRLVSDEIGNPTWTPDLASAIVTLAAERGPSGIVHAVGTPPVSRLGWAEVALSAAGISVPIEPVPLASFERDSTPPLRAVLEPSTGSPVIDWDAATRSYAAELVAGSRA